MKPFRFDFFQGNTAGANSVAGLFHDVLNADDRAIVIGQYMYEIRELTHYRGTFEGVLARFRQNMIPHAGAPGQREREIDLAEHEGLIEKNYFHYRPGTDVLIYQQNKNGASAWKLGEFLTQFSQQTVTFDPVLQLEPTRRFLRGDLHLKSIDIRVARPRNPDLIDGNDWSNRLMDVLSSSGGASMHIKIRADGRAPARHGRYLPAGLKRQLTGLIRDQEVARAVFKMEDDQGVAHPIDLVADRLFSNQNVTMNGRYPVVDSIREAMRNAYAHRDAELQEILGANGRRLD